LEGESHSRLSVKSWFLSEVVHNKSVPLCLGLHLVLATSRFSRIREEENEDIEEEGIRRSERKGSEKERGTRNEREKERRREEE
jgi:hypothetical protein